MPTLDEIDKMRNVYHIPDMEKVMVSKDIIYKTVNGLELKLDAYYPPDMAQGTTRPAVILVHGGSQPEHFGRSKDSVPYTSWGQLIAASGLIAIMFNHHTPGFVNLYEGVSDVEDLIQYVRSNATSLGIDPNTLGIWAFSAGPLYCARPALHGTPAYVRCFISYYGGMSILDRKYFHYSEDEEEVVKACSAIHYLVNEEPEKLPPFFLAKAGRDQSALNDSIDDFVRETSVRNVPLTFMNHPTGLHGFDIFNDDKRSHEIIKATLEFVKTHLTKQ